jgi:hypothetical protein
MTTQYLLDKSYQIAKKGKRLGSKIKYLPRTSHLLCRYPNILFEEKKYIFIISHIRSRSSLLSHILGSNPAIAGSFESQISYLKPIDFLHLRILVHLANQGKKHTDFYLDKILWNNHNIAPDIYQKENLRFVFLLRNPQETIRSIIHMGNKLNLKFYQEPEWISRYYTERLNNIRQWSEMIPHERAFFVDSEKIIQHTDQTLDHLSNWLGLKERLTPHYTIFANTGKPILGDPLENIKNGKIIKKRVSDRDLEFPKNLFNTINASYKDCRKALSESFAGV